MKNTILLCCALILTANLTHAANQEQRQAAENLLIAMDAVTLTEHSIEQALTLEMQQNPQLLPYREVMRDFYTRHIGYEIMKPDMIKIYTEKFSAEELSTLADSKIMANLQELQDLVKAE